MIDKVFGSIDAAVAVDFGLGAGRLMVSTDRMVGASFVARRADLVLESGFVTVGRVGVSRRRISVFFGREVFLRVNGDGTLLDDAISLRRGRRVSCPEASAGFMLAAFSEAFACVAGRGVLFAVCFRISVLGRWTRALDTEGRAVSARRVSRCVNLGRTSGC